MENTHILLVDDNINFISECEKSLKKFSNFRTVGTVNNGQEAIEYIKSNKVDIIVLDMIMPHLDGFGVLKYINSIKGEKPKIIITSIISHDKIISQLYESGIVFFLMKPFMIENLIDKITYLQEFNGQNGNVLDKDIILILNDLGVPRGLKGYKYLKEAIIFTVDRGIDGVEVSAIYKYLSDMYCTSPKAIEKAIRVCIETTFNYGNVKELQSIFSYNISTESGKRPIKNLFIILLID